MEAWLTREWQRTSPWQIFLRPVSWLFRLLVAMRRGAYRAGFLKSGSIGVPVVIVGNITVGGTGKTPLVLALVEALEARGMHCGIVTRGYQRGSNARTAKVIRILPSTTDNATASDEATLLARRSGVPVFACADRLEAAKQALLNYAICDAILSDDGLQHYALQREVEICVIDGARGLGNGELLPAGPLREPAGRLNTVSAVVVNRGDGSTKTPHFSTIAPVFEMTLENELFLNLKSDQRLTADNALEAFAGKRIFALAGTGHPDRFFSHVAGLGFSLADTKFFPDHHPFSATDMPGPDADIILMTEKDAVKCGSFADERMWFMRIDAVLPDALIDFVMNKLEERKPDHVTRPQAS